MFLINKEVKKEKDKEININSNCWNIAKNKEVHAIVTVEIVKIAFSVFMFCSFIGCLINQRYTNKLKQLQININYLLKFC